MKNIYGNRAGGINEFGLDEATDKSDFDIKFSILKRNGDLGFYDCFMIGGFMDSVIQSATERTDFKGLYFQRHLESIHFLEKLS